MFGSSQILLWTKISTANPTVPQYIRKPLPVLEEAFFLWILEAADDTEGGEQGREGGNNHLDDCLDDVLFHRLK